MVLSIILGSYVLDQNARRSSLWILMIVTFLCSLFISYLSKEKEIIVKRFPIILKGFVITSFGFAIILSMLFNNLFLHFWSKQENLAIYFTILILGVIFSFFTIIIPNAIFIAATSFYGVNILIYYVSLISLSGQLLGISEIIKMS
jgi:hypothetical protein